MALFNIDFSQFTPSSVKKTQPSGGVSPTSKITPKIPTGISIPKTIQPKSFTPTPGVSTQLPTTMPQKTQESKSLVQKGFELLSKPSEITERLLTGGKGYEQWLADKGIKNKKGLDVNDVGSFAARMVLDPINLIPFGKAFGLAGKTVSKIVKPLGKYADDVARVAAKFPEVAGKLPIPTLKGMKPLTEVAEGLGKKFVKGFQLPEEYNFMKSAIPGKISSGTESIVKEEQTLFGKPISFLKKLTGGQAKFSKEAIEAVPKFLEPKGAGAGTDLAALKKSLGSEFERLRPVLHEVKKQLDNEIYDLVKRARIDGETAKRLLTQGGYYPHLDFAPKTLQKYFGKFGTKLGEKRFYLRGRKGIEGFSLNAPRAISKRRVAQLTDNVIQDFLKEVKNKFGTIVKKGKDLPEGYTAFLADNTPGRLKELKGFALPARIAEDLNETLREGGKIAQSIDFFNAYWKPAATSLNPSFHLMNVMGNLYNSWLGGMKDPRRYLQAIKGGFNDAERVVLKASGILDRGQFAGDLVERAFSNPEMVADIKPFQKFRQFGEFFENNARSAFFLDQRTKLLKKGIDEITANRQALKKVNEYLFDYLSGLTPFETNYMRRIFPFYTWARFNIPLQLKSIVETPEKVAFVSKLYKELNKEGVPEGAQEGFDIPTPFVDSEGKAIRWRPQLPMQDVFDLTSPKSVLDRVHPLLKEAPQVALWLASGGRAAPLDTYTLAPRTDVDLPFGEQVKDVGAGVLRSFVRPARTLEKISGEGLPGVIRYGLGSGTYSVSPESSILRSKSQKRSQQKAIYNRIRSIQRSNKTREEKQKEIERLLQY